MLGTYLGRAGVDHLIIDKAHYPRAHVGESLSYAATTILEEIDFLPVMERERYRHQVFRLCDGEIYDESSSQTLARLRQMLKTTLSSTHTTQNTMSKEAAL